MKVFFNRYGELRSGWSITAVLFTMFLMQFAGVFISVFFTFILPPDILNSPYTGGLLQVLVEMLMFASVLLLFWLVYKKSPSFLGLSAKGALKDFGGGVAVGAVCISAVALLTIGLGFCQAEWIGFTPHNIPYIMMNLVVHLSVGLSEETIARGYLMTVSKTTRKNWFIIGISGLLFGLLHLSNPGVTVLSLANIVLIGVAFALMFVRRGSIWMPVGFHFIWNFMQGSLYGSAVSGTDVVPLIGLTQVGPDLFTGGEFGFEGNVFTTIITILCCLFVVYVYPKCKDPRWTLDSDLPLVRVDKPPVSP